MADTASLIARVKTEGVEAANRQLDDFATNAALAEGQADALARAAKKMSDEEKKAAQVVKGLSDATEKLGNQVAVLEEAQVNGARSAVILAAQLKLGSEASAEEAARVGELAARLYDLDAAQKASAADAQKAANAEKQAAQDRQRAAAAVQQLENNLKLLSTAQTQGERGAAILNQQLKAGSGASEEQRQRIAALTGQIYDMSTASKNATDSQNQLGRASGSNRAQIQQLGYQLQDFVVQVQGGTSAFVAFGQQGSQLAGAFGPGGAILGAVIALGSAIGGGLYNALTSTKISTKDLDDANQALSFAFAKNTQGVYELSDGMVQLSKTSADAAKNLLSLTTVQAKVKSDAAVKAVRDSGKALADYGVSSELTLTQLDGLVASGQNVNKVLKDAREGANTAATGYGNIIAVVNDLAGKYQVSAEKATDLLVAQRAFNKEPTAANAQKVADASLGMAQAAGKNSDSLFKNTEALQKNALAMAEADALTKAAAEAQKNFGKNTNETTRQQQKQNEAYVSNLEIQGKRGKEKIEAQYAQEVEAIKSRDKLTDEQQKRALAAASARQDADLKDFNAKEQKKSDVQDRRDAAAATKAANAAAVQRKNADNFIAGIERGGVDQIAKINTIEQQKLEEVQKYREKGIITEKEFQDAVTNIQANAEDARQKELDRRQQEAAKKQGQHDQYLADIDALNATELEKIDAQQTAREARAKEFRDRGIINEKEYQKAIVAIAGESDKKRLDSYQSTLSDTTSALKTALGEGNALYKAAAITQTIIETYKGATAAYASLATIPIVGPGLGIAAAAAVTAAGLANVGKIRSAREQGGQLSYGQVSTIAERGKPEVIMPAGASRVRTAEQMRQIMGDHSANNGIPQINIVNQTTGRVDEVQQQQDDQGRITLLIREIVSSDLQDSNSRIAKSRKVSRGQPGIS